MPAAAASPPSAAVAGLVQRHVFERNPIALTSSFPTGPTPHTTHLFRNTTPHRLLTEGLLTRLNTRCRSRRLRKESRRISGMKNFPSSSSRRAFLRSGAAIAAAGCLPTGAPLALAAPAENPGKLSPIRLGLASYTLRTLTRAQVIAAMKDLRLTLLN